MIAFFPGKFQPPHLGHIISLMKLYDEYDEIIVGITEDTPKDSEFQLPLEARKNIFKAALQHLPKFRVVTLKGTIEGGAVNDLPEFDVCLSGNEKVIEKIQSWGKQAEFLPRAEGAGFSGATIRKGIDWG